MVLLFCLLEYMESAVYSQDND